MKQPMEYMLSSGEKVTDLGDFVGLVRYYEAYCTAEYIEYEYDVPEEICLDLGYEVRRRMEKYDGNESDTVECLMYDLDDKVKDWLEKLPSEYAGEISMTVDEIDISPLDELLEMIFGSPVLKEKFLNDKYEII